MLICPYCGTPAEPANRFCKVCGNPLAPSAMPPAMGAPPSVPLYAAPPSVPLYPTYPTYPTSPPPVAPNPYAPSTTPLAGYPATGYPGSPYAQPSTPLAPYPQAYAPVAVPPVAGGGFSAVPRQVWIISGVVLAAILVAAFIFTRNSSLTGEWYGPITFPGQGSSVVTTGEIYLNLQQGSDGSITGSGSSCSPQGGQPSDFDLTGTISGSNVTLNLSAGLGSLTFTGTFSGGSMVLSDNAVFAPATLTLSRGSQDAYNSACQSLPSQ